ncbi:methyltransferase [Alteromonas facilis]|uniref:methyltransferase n=1 Tax=Alteromonas facilis TaxID=2048004 RepID=UPI000C286D34|nr:methyltransferase [Alteromonas facilis]
MTHIKTDQSFDGIANKFDKNIYGTTKGQLRQAVLESRLTPILNTEPSLSLIDIGGGTGEMARFALNLGHSVLINDISNEAIELAKSKLSEFSHASFSCDDLHNIEAEPADLVLCHAVLEWTIKPFEVLAKVKSLIKPGGLLSLTFFNYDAALFGNALYGNFDLIRQGMVTKNRVRLNPNNAQRPKDILAHLAKDYDILSTAGIRCFHDYMRDREHQTLKYSELLALELEYAEKEPYKWLGKYFHIIARHQPEQPI